VRNEVDVVIRKEGKLLDFMRTRPSLPLAKIRDVRLRQLAHKELIKLIQRLFLSGSQNIQAAVFAAVEPGSGCTFICTRIAEILANHLEEPVCLVDANFRSPRINEQFEFAKVLGGRRDGDWTFKRVGANYVQAKASNLCLAVYRPTPADCPRLASLERFEALINDLRKDFTYILIDAPPLNEYADAALFTRMADGLVIVLEANDTRRETARKVKDMLDANGVPVAGVVLNKRTFPIPEPLYRRL
jgi:succinoglycan biosynthesis transport protein ExoP